MKLFRFLFIVFAALALALLIVREGNRITRLGYLIALLEKEKATWEEKNRKLEYEIDTLKAPENIVAKINSMNIGLVPPQKGFTEKSEQERSKEGPKKLAQKEEVIKNR